MHQHQDVVYRIEPLGDHHDREAFCCGNDIIDSFCRDRAQADHDRGKVRVFVACPDETNRVVGFYSLCVSTLAPKTILGLGKFGQRPIPAVYLAMVGVSEEHAGRGLGKALMFSAFEKTLIVAENAGAYCLWLEAVDDEKAGFYEHLDFQRITPRELRMFIPVNTIRDALADP